MLWKKWSSIHKKTYIVIHMISPKSDYLVSQMRWASWRERTSYMSDYISKNTRSPVIKSSGCVDAYIMRHMCWRLRIALPKFCFCGFSHFVCHQLQYKMHFSIIKEVAKAENLVTQMRWAPCQCKVRARTPKTSQSHPRQDHATWTLSVPCICNNNNIVSKRISSALRLRLRH